MSCKKFFSYARTKMLYNISQQCAHSKQKTIKAIKRDYYSFIPNFILDFKSRDLLCKSKNSLARETVI